MSKYKKIIAQEVRQNNDVFFLASIKVPELNKISYVRFFEGIDLVEEEGIQRKPKRAEIKNLVKHLVNTGFCPLPIWLNDPEKQITVTEKYKAVNIVELSIPKNYKLHCSDGELRRESYLSAYKNHKEQMENFEIPVIITRLKKSSGIREFVNINTYHRSLPRNHRSGVLWINAVQEGEESFRTKKERRDALSFAIIDRLTTSTSSPLFDMVVTTGRESRRPRYNKSEIRKDSSKRNLRIIAETSFLTSLSEDFLKKLDPVYLSECSSIIEQREKIFSWASNYWRALKYITYKLWENPINYAFFEAIGIRAQVILFFYLLNKVKSSGEKLTTRNFRDRLEKISRLKEVDYWCCYKAWENHIAFDGNNLGWKKHSDFQKGENLIGISGSEYGMHIAEELIEQIESNEKKGEKIKEKRSNKVEVFNSY